MPWSAHTEPSVCRTVLKNGYLLPYSGDIAFALATIAPGYIHLRCRVRVRVAIGNYARFRVRVRFSVKSRAEVGHSISIRD